MRPTGGWGYTSDTEILFPMRVAPLLSGLRGPRWNELVQHVIAQPDASLDQLAFSLLMIRLSGCLTCHTDCFRALRGCSYCSRQAVRRYRGDDEDLALEYEQALREVTTVLRRETVPGAYLAPALLEIQDG